MIGHCLHPPSQSEVYLHTRCNVHFHDLPTDFSLVRGSGSETTYCFCILQPIKTGRGNSLGMNLSLYCIKPLRDRLGSRGAGASPAGTAAAGPMLEAKLMNLIKGQLQKF